jgi:hypothetical protein
MKRNTIIIIVVVLIAGSIIFSRFFSSEKTFERIWEEAIEKETGAKVDIDLSEEGFKYTGEGGTFSAGSQTIPETFPKDIPIYPNAEILFTLSQVEENAHTAHLGSTHSLGNVKNYYEQELPRNGWEPKDTMEFGGMTTKTYTKNGYLLVINLTSIDDSGTNIGISYEKESD